MPVTHQVRVGVKRNVTTELPLEVFTAFEAVCKKVGMSKAQYLRKLVEGVVQGGEQKDG
jgi:hypothetical protein